MIDTQLAEVSNLLIVVAIVVYVLAMIGFTADLARVSQVRSDVKLAERERERAHATAPAGGVATLDADDPDDADDAETAKPAPESSLSPLGFGLVMSTVGVVLHGGGVILRGFATGRVPWGNMYEFAMTGSAAVMVMFLLLGLRRTELRHLGAFVLGPMMVLMLLAQTLWIVPAAHLTPSLQNSHWLIIHVSVAILSTSVFTLGAVVAMLQLVSTKRAARGPQAWGRVGQVLDRLPGPRELEQLAFRIHAIAFVGWTFTLIAGAIWANYAWGRAWGWDPKEIWTFVIWVVYAAYLHARATQGFRGNRAAYFALAGFACLIINFTVVNTVINGLHSYSGLG